MKIIKWDKIDFRGRVENVCDKKTDMEKKIRADHTTLFYQDKKCIQRQIWKQFKVKKQKYFIFALMKIDITLSKKETVSVQFTNWVGTGQCGNLPTLVVSWRPEFKRGFNKFN